MQLGDKGPILALEKGGVGCWRLWGPLHSFREQKGGYDKDPSQQLGNGGWAMETLPLIWGGEGVGCEDRLCSFGEWIGWWWAKKSPPIGLEGRGALSEPPCTHLESGWGNGGWWYGTGGQLQHHTCTHSGYGYTPYPYVCGVVEQLWVSWNPQFFFIIPL